MMDVNQTYCGGQFVIYTSVCASVLSHAWLLCDSMDGRLPSSSIDGIFQAWTLEWVAISSSRGSFWPKDQTHVSGISCIGRQLLYHCNTYQTIMLYTWK